MARVDPAALGEDFEGRTALLSPFDRLVHDRARAQELFDFRYTLEMYQPRERRWAASPSRSADQLIGKVDATAVRKATAAGARDPPGRDNARAMTKAVDAELEDRLVARAGCGRAGDRTEPTVRLDALAAETAQLGSAAAVDRRVAGRLLAAPWRRSSPYRSAP